MIFFDIDDTLLDDDKAQEKAAQYFFKQNRKLQNMYTEKEFPTLWDVITKKSIRRYMDGELNFQQQRQERIRNIFKENLQADQTDALFQTYLNIYEQSWATFSDVIPVLEKYKDVPKGIISNGEKYQQRQKLKQTGIDHYFSTVVISDDIGVNKPDPEIFRYACKQACKNPSDCYYIGDKEVTDAKAAVDAGLRGVWLNRKFIDEKKEKVPEILSLNTFQYIVF